MAPTTVTLQGRQYKVDSIKAVIKQAKENNQSYVYLRGRKQPIKYLEELISN